VISCLCRAVGRVLHVIPFYYAVRVLKVVMVYLRMVGQYYLYRSCVNGCNCFVTNGRELGKCKLVTERPILANPRTDISSHLRNFN
jgi:hypothetical protein